MRYISIICWYVYTYIYIYIYTHIIYIYIYIYLYIYIYMRERYVCLYSLSLSLYLSRYIYIYIYIYIHMIYSFYAPCMPPPRTSAPRFAQYIAVLMSHALRLESEVLCVVHCRFAILMSYMIYSMCIIYDCIICMYVIYLYNSLHYLYPARA